MNDLWSLSLSSQKEKLSINEEEEESMSDNNNNDPMYFIFKRHIKDLFPNINKDEFEKKYMLHKFILSIRCPSILNINDEMKLKIKNISNQGLTHLLQWIHKGEFCNNVSFSDYNELYYIFKYIITDKPKICDYILFKMDEMINSYNDDVYKNLIINLINSSNIETDIFNLFLSKLSNRKNINDDFRLEIFELIDNKISHIFDQLDINDKRITDISQIDKDILSKDFKDDFKQFIKTKHNHDITFDFGNGILIHAHKVVLNNYSIIFNEFNVNINWDDNGKESIVIMNNDILSSKSFEILINYLYSFDTSFVSLDEDNYIDIISLSYFIKRYYYNEDKNIKFLYSLHNRLEELLFDKDLNERIVIKLFRYLFNNKKDNSILKNLLFHLIHLICNKSIDTNEFSIKEKIFISMFTK